MYTTTGRHKLNPTGVAT